MPGSLPGGGGGKRASGGSSVAAGRAAKRRNDNKRAMQRWNKGMKKILPEYYSPRNQRG